MRLQELGIRDFGNYRDAQIFFSPQRNFIFGENAQGKSNLLEAIAVLCLTKGVRNATDEALVRLGAAGYQISGTFVDERGLQTKASVRFHKAGRKEIGHNGKRLSRQADLVGKVPIVIFSPESHRITSGPPNERRRFMDMLLSQSSPAYLSDLQEYGRILRQRNAVLAAKRNQIEEDELAAWDAALAGVGARIVQARALLFDAIREQAQEIYGRVDASTTGRLKLVYQSQMAPGADAREQFLELLQRRRDADWRRTQTTSGPHRDDIGIFLGDVDLRHYGSRGEHKSVLLALKLLEAQYLKQMKDTAALVILDDLFSELDEQRCRRCLDLFAGFCQLFVSSVVAPAPSRRSDDLLVEIRNGSILNTRYVN